MNGTDALAAAEAHAADLAAAAESALRDAINHPNPARSGAAWDAYRGTAGRAAAARAAAAVLAERLTGACLSCHVQLTPGTAGNVAACDFHDQTCDRCDADLIHPHGRAA